MNDPIDIRGHGDVATNGLERQIAFRLTTLSSLISQRSNLHCTRTMGIKDFDRRLIQLIAAYAPISLKEVSRMLMTDPAQVSRAVQILVTDGTVQRVENAADRRAVELSMTETGQILAHQLAEAARARHRELMEPLPIEEREAMLVLLETLVERAQCLLSRDQKLFERDEPDKSRPKKR